MDRRTWSTAPPFSKGVRPLDVHRTHPHAHVGTLSPITVRPMRLRHAGKRLITGNVLVCIVCAFVSRPAFSLDRYQSIDQLGYTFWSQKDGAPSEITALAQTSDGFLWIGSDVGLFRFDGVKFEEYKPPPGVKLPSHIINSLLATPDGGLWIAFSPTGLGLLKNGSLTVFTGKNELPDSPVHCFARDHEGRIWAGTEMGLVLRQGTRWIDIGQRWNLPREMIRYLLVDREGTLWVATIRRIAFLTQGSRKFELGGTIGTGVTTLAQAKDGRVWLADDGRGEVRPTPPAGRDSEGEFPAIVGNTLRELLFDRDGALWITDMGSGIIRIPFPEKLRERKYGPHDPELQTFSTKDGFSGGFAYKLLEDREGNIWVGCSKGLIRFRGNDVTPVSLPQGYQKLTLLAGNSGGLWVGTISEKPFLHIRGKSLLHESVGDDAVSVLREANGDVWWGCRSGIWRQRGTSFKFFPLPKPAVPDHMYDIIPSLVDGGLWIRLGDNGFVRFIRGVWNFHDWPKGIPSTGMFRHGPSASYRDRTGRVWLGYASGQVIVLDGKKVTLYSENDGLDVGRIKVIRGLGEHIWLGGELGLVFFSKGRFHRLTVAGDQQLGAVSGIIATADGGLWLNEMRGIVHISPEEVRQVIADANHRVKYQRFDYFDGLPGAPQMDPTNSTAVETTDGRLWFATDDGLAIIDPAHLIMNRLPPPVSILSIADRKRRWPKSNAVRFSAGTQTIEIDYTALSLSVPERVKFRYKLEGVDTEWQNVGTRRQAYYSNLGPGHYRFRVIACNNDDVWNNIGASMNFSIAPAYYQTLLFHMACVIIFAVFLWTLYRLRLHTIEQRHLERKRAEDALRKAQAELARVNRVSTMGELTASLAHEINQPLAAIVANGEACLRWLKAEPANVDEARESARKIIRDGSRAGEVIKGIRGLARKSALQLAPLSINELIEEVIALTHGEIQRNQVLLKTELTPDLPGVLGDRVQLEQVVLNLILNGMEAMSELALEQRSLVVGSGRSDANGVLVYVRDCGAGISADAMQSIFKPFFTTKPGGTGMGLSISRSIVEAHGGRLWAAPNDDRGVTFSFSIPGVAR
jgi:signal transduction histidine kinase/ligand-binding sensor domain-containing protein